MAAKEFFDELEAQAEPDKIKHVNHSYLFEIAGEGSWRVDVRDGALKVTEGADQAADVTISTSGAIFEAIASGEQNPMKAYMSGKLKIKGNIAAALELQKLF